MSKSTLPDNNSVVGTTDAQTETTPRTVVCDVATDPLTLNSFDVFRTAAWATEDTIHRVRP